MKLKTLLLAGVLSGVAFAAQAQTTLTFINCGGKDDPTAPVQAKHIAEWEKANPNFKVAEEYLPWGQCQERATTLAGAGNAPALAYMGSRTVRMLGAADMIVRVSLSAEEKSSYEPSVLATVSFDGKEWGLPRAFSTKALYWNKDLFAKAGLPTDKGPQTFEEVLAAAKAIKEKTGAAGFGIPAASFDNTMHEFLNWLYSNGGSVVDAEGKVTFDSKENVEALEFYGELAKYAQPGPVAYDRAKLEPLFAEGAIAMYTNGGWGRKKAGNVNFGLEMIPAGPSGKKSTLLITDSIVVFKGTGVEDAALSLAKYLTTPERQFEIDVAGGWTPIRNVAGVKDIVAKDPSWSVFIDAIPTGGPEPLMVDYIAMQDAMNEAIQSVVTGKVAAKDAVKKAAEALADLNN